MRVNTHEPWCVSGGERTTFGSHFSFSQVGPRAPTQAIGLADKHQHLLRHLASFTQVCSGDPGTQGRSRLHGRDRG